jgi:excisionase family DNA binding protein
MTATDTPPALLTISEVARTLNCSVHTVRAMLVEGSLTPVRLRQVPGAQVRVRVSEVERIISPDWSRERRGS